MENNYSYKPESAWEIYKDVASLDKIHKFAEKYLNFISRCKTERETIAYICEELAKAGYSEDFSQKTVYRPLRGKALFAAKAGSASLKEGLWLISAHGDSPRLDFKQKPIIEQAGIAQAKTHYYGGIRKYQWLARPLALAGIIVKRDGSIISVRIGDLPEEPVFCVADLLPHLAQKQAALKLSEAFDGEKLNIVLGHMPELAQDSDQSEESGEKSKENAKESIKNSILKIFHEKYGICEEDFITAELEAVPAGNARFVGLDEALLGGYGQDDRICVFCAVQAMLENRASQKNIGIMIWDKEEIGSDGATGATSRFLEYCVEDLTEAWEPAAKVSRVFLNSRAISADVTAALDPDYQDVHEKQNAALIGYGPCFSKFTGSRGKYDANDADAEYFGELRAMLAANNIPWQVAELGKVDLGGGGTIAKYLAALGMKIIDFGPALLSMHSPFELASAVDLYATKEAYRIFMADK